MPGPLWLDTVEAKIARVPVLSRRRETAKEHTRMHEVKVWKMVLGCC